MWARPTDGAPERAAHLDLRIAELAEQQHGVVARRQLMAIGLRDAAILHRIRIRRLHRVHRGVYAVGADRLRLHARCMAAVLACPPGAVVSHRSAAALLGLQPAPGGRVDVTIKRGGSRNRAGVAVHATRSLWPADVTRCERVPCTSVARTMLDLAAGETTRALDRLIEQAHIMRLYDRAAFEDALARSNGRAGAARLRRRLGEVTDEPAPARSELERRFLALVRRARLPMPAVNAFVAGHEVDFHWPAQRLVVETDGRATHGNAVAFERDRRRDLDLELAGWHVVRVSWRQVTTQPGRLISLLRTRLAEGAAALARLPETAGVSLDRGAAGASAPMPRSAGERSR